MPSFQKPILWESDVLRDRKQREMREKVVFCVGNCAALSELAS